MIRQKSARRRTRQLAEAYDILKPLRTYNIPVDGVIQCGLGDWAEGPALLQIYGHVPFLAVDPIQRYAREAWAAGFRGPIVQGVLWHTTGKQFTLQDFRTRTSMLDTRERRGPVETTSYTLDDVVRNVDFRPGRLLLWMDVEGVELGVLAGAGETLKKTTAIVCELKDVPKMDGWPSTPEMIDGLRQLGYVLMGRIADNGIFFRQDYVSRCHCDPLLGGK